MPLDAGTTDLGQRTTDARRATKGIARKKGSWRKLLSASKYPKKHNPYTVSNRQQQGKRYRSLVWARAGFVGARRQLAEPVQLP